MLTKHITRLLKRFYPGLAWIAILVFFAGTNAMAGSKQWQTRLARISQEYGIVVEFDDIRFPAHWDSWRPQWRVVPEQERIQALEKLRIDLSHYDPDFLQRHLNRIYLVHQLSFNGQPYGGTNDHINRWLYLQHEWLGDTARHGRAMGLHHEFSSILLKLYPDQFNARGWQQTNPARFEYAFARSLETNIATGKTSRAGGAILCQKGFLSPYGTLTLEDDINTFAQYLIAKPLHLYQHMSNYPRVSRKANLLSDFYRKIGHTKTLPVHVAN